MSAIISKESHDEMREAIVKVATQIFSRFGFKKTSMDDIAKGLRMGKSSIYYYFRGKEEIFRAVVDQEVEILKEKVEIILSSADDTVSKLRSYVKLRMDLVKHLANYTEILKNDDLMNMEITEKFRKKYDEEEISIIRQILEEGVQKGTFKIKDIDMSELAIITAMKGLEAPLVATNIGDEKLNRVIDDILDILFYGIVNR
ncbi:MAG TPA: TetR/AcrR family transcriptional regulator [Tenuifilaceae bacterium]|nr:TetR/AcrR family transcriptional regulator [Tenuifilaceae bacterium]